MITTDPPQLDQSSVSCERWAGVADPTLLAGWPRTGRRRRWVYAAAGDASVTVGVAAFDAGLLGLGTVFAFAVHDGAVHTWDAGPGRAGSVGGLGGSASVRRGRGHVRVEGGSFTIDVPVDGGRLLARLEAEPVSPVTLVTPTPRGGWNATTKAAGHRVRGTVEMPSGTHALDGLGWTDFTDGRQDRVTTWRWVSGAGMAADGRRVGLHASTGMNRSGLGEDVVWWDGLPHGLEVAGMRPVVTGAFGGAWRLDGPGWQLRLAPVGVRAADEGIGPIRSRYHQPIGSWTGTLPDPDGVPIEVVLRGVAEDHEARW